MSLEDSPKFLRKLAAEYRRRAENEMEMGQTSLEFAQRLEAEAAMLEAAHAKNK